MPLLIYLNDQFSVMRLKTVILFSIPPLSPFYVFPCGHKFHSDCIIAEMLPLATNNKRRQVIAAVAVHLQLPRHLSGLFLFL